jgi:epoxyqueuosine reductase
MSITEDIKDYALDIGYSHVGITTADDFTDHIDQVQSRGSIYDFYVQDPRKFMQGAKPKTCMPEARSIISLVWDYSQKKIPRIPGGKDRPDLYGQVLQSAARPHKRSALLADAGFFGKNGPPGRPEIFYPGKTPGPPGPGQLRSAGTTLLMPKNPDRSWCLVRLLWTGNWNTTRQHSKSNVLRTARRVWMPAPPERYTNRSSSILGRCIAFNAWWTQDGRPCVTSHIPHDIRGKMGTRVHGCDVCQEACPRNSARLKARSPQDPFLVQLAQEFSLSKMLGMPDRFYEKTVRRLCTTTLMTKKYFQRNAAIAMGKHWRPGLHPRFGSRHGRSGRTCPGIHGLGIGKNRRPKGSKSAGITAQTGSFPFG